MSNGQPSGAQTSTTTEKGAYNVNGATSGNAVAANATNPNTGLAPTYRIPLENEWYKAAYYKGGSTNAGYWTYATQSNSAPGNTIGSSPNQANYWNGATTIGHATDVGAFSGSGSAYGTFDQSGNVYQWNDLDGTAGSSRGLRGGDWTSFSTEVASWNRIDFDPSVEGDGFRLASSDTTTLTPAFGSATATATGFTVQVTNYDALYTWAGTATASGTVVVSGTGLVTVTNVAAATSSTATITTTRTGYLGGSNTVAATSLNTALTPAFGSTTATATGFTVQITNYDSSYTWAGTATAPGSVAISGTGLVTVTGLAAGTGSAATITTTKSNTVGGGASVGGSSIVLMSMVTVGNVGNAADTTGYGAVSYSYQIGTYDVTGSQYTAFLNAVGSTDTYALYNASMGTDTGAAQISRLGTAGTYTYAIMNNTGNRPITYVSWFDCARFSNWMSNGQPSGAQNSTTTENGAYYVNGATTGNAVAVNATNPNTGSAPTYRMPLENEWYKAAYYKGGSTNAGYWTYATQSNSPPGTTIGSSSNQANYYNGRSIGHATDVGAFSGSGSAYGTFDQTGNVYQWNDLDGTAGSSRGLRGGDWYDGSYFVSSSSRIDDNPSIENGYYYGVGFRLASPV